jgi:hypothetical protein
MEPRSDIAHPGTTLLAGRQVSSKIWQQCFNKLVLEPYNNIGHGSPSKGLEASSGWASVLQVTWCKRGFICEMLKVLP